MISPHTKPGTKVVCIQDDYLWILRNCVREPFNNPDNPGVSSPHEHLKGTVLTLLSIQPEFMALSGFSVSFEETGAGRFPLECYRVLDLPSCLTDLLVSERTPELV